MTDQTTFNFKLDSKMKKDAIRLCKSFWISYWAFLKMMTRQFLNTKKFTIWDETKTYLEESIEFKTNMDDSDKMSKEYNTDEIFDDIQKNNKKFSNIKKAINKWKSF